jgi:hypothetical protein
MKTRVRFCPSCCLYPAEARLVRVLEQMGLELSVEFGREAPAEAFTVYLGDEPISGNHFLNEHPSQRSHHGFDDQDRDNHL